MRLMINNEVKSTIDVFPEFWLYFRILILKNQNSDFPNFEKNKAIILKDSKEEKSE